MTINTRGIIAGVVSAASASQSDLSKMLPGNHIDEMSLLFKTDYDMDVFVDRFLELGVGTNFNNVRDVICHLGTKEAFDICFRFLQMEGVPWRIEAMAVTKGASKLHNEALGGAKDDPVVVHASFKAGNMEGLMLAAEALKETEPHVGTYHNSYGVFSYFGAFRSGPFLKPRISFADDKAARSQLQLLQSFLDNLT